jgi:excisionase family DNA binding protein
MAKKLLTIKEAAQELGVSIKTIRRWESLGKIESIRTSGGHRRFKLKQVAPQKVVTPKKILPYILASTIISAGITYSIINSHYKSQLNTIKEQLNTFINQTNNQEITINNPDNKNLIDSGISQITPENNGSLLVISESIKDLSSINLSSTEQDKLLVTQIISGIGFIVSTKEDITSPIYFNWEILN